MFDILDFLSKTRGVEKVSAERQGHGLGIKVLVKVYCSTKSVLDAVKNFSYTFSRLNNGYFVNHPIPLIGINLTYPKTLNVDVPVNKVYIKFVSSDPTEVIYMLASEAPGFVFLPLTESVMNFHVVGDDISRADMHANHMSDRGYRSNVIGVLGFTNVSDRPVINATLSLANSIANFEINYDSSVRPYVKSMVIYGLAKIAASKNARFMKIGKDNLVTKEVLDSLRNPMREVTVDSLGIGLGTVDKLREKVKGGLMRLERSHGMSRHV